MKRRQLPRASTPAKGSDYLVAIADQINEAHQQVTRTALEGARHVGQLLLRAKEQVGHGHWAGWIEKHCDFDARTAQRYMQIAEHWHQVDCQAVSIADALTFVAKPSRATDLAAAFPELPADEQAEVARLLGTEEAQASADRQARAAAKQGRQAPPAGSAELSCPECGHCWRP